MTGIADVHETDAATAQPVSLLGVSVGFGVLALVIAITTFIHLIFWGFSGEVVSVDAVLAVIVIAVWAIGLIGLIALRRSIETARRWGRIAIVVTSVLVVADIIRFIVYFRMA